MSPYFLPLPWSLSSLQFFSILSRPSVHVKVPNCPCGIFVIISELPDQISISFHFIISSLSFSSARKTMVSFEQKSRQFHDLYLHNLLIVKTTPQKGYICE